MTAREPWPEDVPACPFCGHRRTTFEEITARSYVDQCDGCGARGPVGIGPDGVEARRRARIKSSEDPVTVAPPPYFTYSGPIVAVAHSVTTPSAPTGQQELDLGQSSAYSTGGSVCELGHDVQYRFDWGDGTYSGWLAVGVTSASHAWMSLGSHEVRSQARCAVDTVIVSSWSAPLAVSVTGSVLLTEDFMDATGWLQQNVGTGGTSLWALSNTSYAGGTPYEARCQWYNVNPFR